VLFRVNTPGGPWNVVLNMGPDPPTKRGRGPTIKFWGPLISPEWLKLDT